MRCISLVTTPGWLYISERIMFELAVLCTGASIIMVFDTDLPWLHNGNRIMFELAVLCTTVWCQYNYGL